MPATDKIRYDLKKMHVIFALSCAAIFVATIAMMAKDHNDDWRWYQKKNYSLQAAVLSREEQRLLEGDYPQRKAELESQLKSAEEQVSAHRAELERLEVLAKSQSLEVDVLGRLLKEQNAIRDKRRADLDLAIRDNAPPEEEARLLAAFDEAKSQRDDTELKLQLAEAELAKVRQEIRRITAARDDALESIEKLESDLERIRKTREKIAPENPVWAFKRWLMEQPIVDGFNSHIRIQQDWIPELNVTLGMSSIARFDRCRTCHLNIDTTVAGNVAAYPHGEPEGEGVEDWVAAGKFPHPHSTHPRTDLYATSSSPHPVSKFGCTICHDGQGSATSFGNAEHTPNDPHQFEVWHEEYGFHPNHFWEYPMQPKRFIESGCIKCHHDVSELGVNPRYGASAPKVVRGFELIKKYGCFGCHEIHGFEGADPIGPDLRVEPSYGAVAAQMLTMLDGAESEVAGEARQLLAQVHQAPLDTDQARNQLKSLLESGASDLPAPVVALASALKDAEGVPGSMRKVGPSFRRLKSKTTLGWVQFWTEEPKRFRPTTRMPQFYNLTNQQDEEARAYEPVELAGIAQYLFDKSVPLDLLAPSEGYQPDVDRGKRLFSERGCLACHSHKAFPDSSADFGPELSRVHEKVNRDPGNPNFSSWLYTWVREPERYHERTRMPNLYLEEYEESGVVVDPAADITAWLVSQGESGEFAEADVNDQVLDVLVTQMLAKAISRPQVAETLATGRYPIVASKVKGDEIELATEDGSAVVDPAEWRRRKLNYVGRKTISKYGCYGCHDVPGFEQARPIGAALQDWGRKDTSKLAFEHIQEWLHHHGEPDGSSTAERVDEAVHAEASGDFTDEVEREEELTAAFFYQSLQSHGRAGFLWQKLRQPRSYDFGKIETKGYDERLRMPKFPFEQDEIEAIATFVLGLVAEPPSSEYIYQPSDAESYRIEGEQLLTKYNCTGCHLVELPEITFGVARDEISAEAKTIEDFLATGTVAPGDVHPEGIELLMKLKPPRVPFTGKLIEAIIDDEPVTLDEFKFRGLVRSLPDPDEDPEDQMYAFDLWETLAVDDSRYLLPKHNVNVPAPQLRGIRPARGGEFAEWLASHMIEGGTGLDGSGPRAPDLGRARQMSPPPLYLEGLKVQTPWLFEFLQEPYRLRHEAVLRMPRFNMSKAEARVLANYFAAVDGAAFPYQQIEPRDADYLASRTAQLRAKGLLGPNEDYLATSWDVLTGKPLPVKDRLCSKCHAIGGSPYRGSGQDDIRGPNLQYASDRLRPDWLHLWIYNPGWVTPYTSMPVNFKSTDKVMPELFGGDGATQVTGVRDAIMNYHRLMESVGGAGSESLPGAVAPAADAAQSSDK